MLPSTYNKLPYQEIWATPPKIRVLPPETFLPNSRLGTFATARRLSQRVVILVRQRWTHNVINGRPNQVENACNDWRPTDVLGKFITVSVHLYLQHDARKAARRVGSSATADTCCWGYPFRQTRCMSVFPIVRLFRSSHLGLYTFLLRSHSIDAAYFCRRSGVVCVFLCLCWAHRWALQNGWRDRDVVWWKANTCGPKEPCIR